MRGTTLTRWRVLVGTSVAVGILILPLWQLLSESLVPSIADSFWRSAASAGETLSSKYRTARVEKGDITSIVSAGGTLNAVVLVEVSSQISGRIEGVFADFNSLVTQGQVIARISPELYESKVAEAEAELEIAQAEFVVRQSQIDRNSAELEVAKANLADARAQTARAKLALNDTKRDLDRKQPLAKRAVVSASHLELVQSAYHSAQEQLLSLKAQELSQASVIEAATAALKMAEAQLTSAAAQIKQREAVLRQAQIDLDRTYIRAPVTGTVVDRNINKGQIVAASLQAPILFTIAGDLTRMQVEAAVVEADVSRFKVGQPVTFTVDAHPDRSFNGTVRQIRKAPASIQNVVTYKVVISADNSDEALLPGMTANLQVVVARRDDVLKVPNAALRFRPREEDGQIPARPSSQEIPGSGTEGQVFLLNWRGQLMSLPVRLGVTDGRMTEVLSGEVEDGQPVVIGTGVGGRGGASAPLATFRLR